jgi:hypothetical protein
MATSSQFLRGDEANRLVPIGRATITNVSASYLLRGRVRAVALGYADDDPRSLSPGASRAARLGLEPSL